MKKSTFHPIAIALKILYNGNIEYVGHWDLPAFQQGRSFHLAHHFSFYNLCIGLYGKRLAWVYERCAHGWDAWSAVFMLGKT